jgi:hypothetical protein
MTGGRREHPDCRHVYCLTSAWFGRPPKAAAAPSVQVGLALPVARVLTLTVRPELTLGVQPQRVTCQ